MICLFPKSSAAHFECIRFGGTCDLFDGMSNKAQAAWMWINVFKITNFSLRVFLTCGFDIFISSTGAENSHFFLVS